MITALIDAEAAAHSCAHACEKAGQGPDEAASAAIGKVFNWIQAAGADRAVLAFSCTRESCFRRTEISAGYKAKRKPPHPFAAPVITSLKRTFAASAGNRSACVDRPRIEADDVIGMLATWPGRRGEHVIVARDGDMLQVPGRHLRLGGKGEPDRWADVTEDQGELAHMTATLEGCSTDGVPGLPGCGEKRAAATLAGIGPAGRWDAVVRAYKKKGLTEGDALDQARLVRVLRWGEYDPETAAVSLWNPGRLPGGDRFG